MRNKPLPGMIKHSPMKQKKDTIGEGFMNAPYRDPKTKGPRASRKDLAYHGYKNFDSNIEKKEDAAGVGTNIKIPKVMKDGSKK